MDNHKDQQAFDNDELPPMRNSGKLRKKLKDWKIPLVLEYISPYAVSLIIAAAITWLAFPKNKYNELLNTILPLTITFAAILAGFQGTIDIILLSLSESRIVKALKKRKHYDHLINYISQSVITVFLYIISAIIILSLITIYPEFEYKRTVYFFLVALFSCCILTNYRITRLSLKMFKSDETDSS